jgi:ATP-binding cassette subfamily C protein LapB
VTNKSHDALLDTSSPTDVDELLECLVVVARIHHHDTAHEALVAGLPLENGRLTPGVVGRAAERADLTARIVKSRLGQLNPALFPVILLLESGRACLLHQVDIKAGQATVSFPELGDACTDISLKGLDDAYSGQAIYVRPKFRFDARGPEVKNQRRRHWFWGVIRENRKLYRDVIIGSALINLFAVAMPLFVMNIYDRVVPNAATETLWVLAVGIFIVLCFDLALRLMRNAFVDLAASRADVKLTSSIMSRALGMRMEAKPASTGSFTSTLQSFESVRSFIGSATVVALVDLPFVVLFMTIIAMIGVPLVIPIIVGAVFVLLYAMAAQSKLHELSETTWRIGAQRNATLVESMSGLETVKALRGESRLQGSWERASAFLSRTSAQLRLVSTSVTSVALWAQHTVSVIIIVVGVYLIVEGDLTQGGLIASYLLSSRAMAPISQAAGLMAQYHQSATALASLNDVMAKPQERTEGKRYIDRPVVQGDIQFDKVSLRYPDEERDALREVGFRIKPGEKVALLGRVGSGKSTLQKLLLGFYQPTGGAVLLDGVDIRQYDPMQLRRHIGYVPQDITLFYGSLRDNIVAGGGVDGIDDDNLLEAINLSGLADLVKSHPHGVELQVGEGGRLLSGGQRQAVAVARAIVNSPSVLLLDEPTSAMDHASEDRLKKQLTQYAADKTLIVVTHRTSLLSLVDRIIVMDGGQVVADGPREQVVEALRKGQVGRAS